MTKVLHIILFVILLLLLTYFGITFLDVIHFKCIFNYFGIYCAGCGTTRMFKALFHFKLYQAFRYNPFMFVLLILSGINIIYNIYLYMKGRKLKYPNYIDIILLVILLLVYMLLRNIPGGEYFLPTKVI